RSCKPILPQLARSISSLIVCGPGLVITLRCRCSSCVMACAKDCGVILSSEFINIVCPSSLRYQREMGSRLLLYHTVYTSKSQRGVIYRTICSISRFTSHKIWDSEPTVSCTIHSADTLHQRSGSLQ